MQKDRLKHLAHKIDALVKKDEEYLQRTHEMLRRGFVDEVRALVREGWENWPPMQSVGYREVLQFWCGRLEGLQFFYP